MSSASFRKEPSMDEILASIRRIIESGDESGAGKGRQGTTADAAPAIVPNEPESAFASTAGSPVPRFDIHYLSPQPDERPFDRPSNDAEADERTHADLHVADLSERPAGELVSIDEGDWRLRTADDAANRDHARRETVEADDAPHAQSFEVPTAELRAENENALSSGNGDDLETDSGRDFAFEFDDAAFEAALHNDAWQERDGDAHADMVADQPHATPEPAAPPLAHAVFERGPVETVHSNPEAPYAEAVHARREMPESVIAGATALLSTQAGDQVAAAFEDLTRAIRDGHMHSMEEMSRELLRPMLQEWLEDNLPRIVEHLVRDEIERISRGPRR